MKWTNECLLFIGRKRFLSFVCAPGYEWRKVNSEGKKKTEKNKKKQEWETKSVWILGVRQRKHIFMPITYFDS